MKWSPGEREILAASFTGGWRFKPRLPRRNVLPPISLQVCRRGLRVAKSWNECLRNNDDASELSSLDLGLNSSGSI